MPYYMIRAELNRTVSLPKIWTFILWLLFHFLVPVPAI
jgi:hypothetical protein